MKDPHFYCVIMAGGLGTRFWPISRDSKPKQFLNFTKSGKSFLRLAWERVQNIVPKENIIVVSLERYRDLVLAEVPEIEDRNLLMEPYNRNTASCIAFACYSILKRDPGAVVLTMPSDQVIDGPELFQETVLSGMDYAAEHDVLLTLGILPRRPDPNFGYIQSAEPMKGGKPVKVKTFTEKPSKELAQVFLDSGEFLWNSGIFIWKASVIAEDLERYAPEVATHWNGWEQFIATPYEREYLERIYPDMPRTSIDYAVMEKSDRVMTMPALFDWNDLGNWDSLFEYFLSDDKGNAFRISGSTLLDGVERSLVYSPRKDRIVAIKGLKDYIVIDGNEVLMICPRDEVKDLIADLSLPEYEKFR